MSDNISGVIALDIVCFNLVIDRVNLQIKELILDSCTFHSSDASKACEL